MSDKTINVVTLCDELEALRAENETLRADIERLRIIAQSRKPIRITNKMVERGDKKLGYYTSAGATWKEAMRAALDAAINGGESE